MRGTGIIVMSSSTGRSSSLQADDSYTPPLPLYLPIKAGALGRRTRDLLLPSKQELLSPCVRVLALL